MNLNELKKALLETVGKVNTNSVRRQIEEIIGSVIEPDGVKYDYWFDEDAVLVHGENSIKMIINIKADDNPDLVEDMAFDLIDKIDDVEDAFYRQYHIEFQQRIDNELEQTLELYLFPHD